MNTASLKQLDPSKFVNPDITAKGEQRAVVALTHLKTLWFNTGSLCNITCKNCFMDSSPKNDLLAYLSFGDVRTYLDEISENSWAVEEIAFTGGEPFMNPDLLACMEEALSRGYKVLVLTNAMKPLLNKQDGLLKLHQAYGQALTLRVSIDHYQREKHEDVRGKDTWPPLAEALQWLSSNGFNLTVAGRTIWGETDAESRAGYAKFFTSMNIEIDTNNRGALVLFPEMDDSQDVPEITTHCWDILGVNPETMMCSTSRMVIKRKGSTSPVVVPCTLLPYDENFEIGSKLTDSDTQVKLNHPHCARFCVLGGASCSAE